jgi:hypothetical protein
MTPPDYSKEDTIEYLLGALSEAETERFDALSVSDTEFADELSAVEADLIDAYVRGELSGQTLARFEGHYLSSPLRRDKVEFARALEVYGKSYATEQIEPAVVPVRRERNNAGFSAWIGFFKNHGSAVRWGLAAAAALLLTAGGWWIFQTGGNPAVASIVLTPPTRGHDQIPTVAISSRTKELQIQLQLEGDDYPNYHVALKEDTASAELWRSGTLTASRKGESKVLNVRVPAGLLKSKIYSLVVSGVERGGTIELVSDYPFRAETK